MTLRKNDTFDVGIKKYMKFKAIDFDRIDGGFGGIYFDRRDNIVVFIKKTGEELKNNGLYLLQPNEGSLDWVNKILNEMSDTNGKLYSESNSNVVNNIRQSIADEKFRVFFIYNFTKYETGNPNYIVSELKKDNIWHYEDSFNYVEPVKEEFPIIKSALKNIDKQSELLYSQILADYRKKDPSYPNIEYLEKVFKNELVRLYNFYHTAGRTNNLGCGLMDTLRECNIFSLTSWFLDNNINRFLDGLYTYSRLFYINEILNKSNFNYYFLRNIFFSIAVNDQDVIRAYLINSWKFVKPTASVTNIITDSLKFVISNDKSTEEVSSTINEINRVIDLKNIGNYEKAFLECLKCVITHNYSNFENKIKIIFEIHKKQGWLSPFIDFSKTLICIPSLVLYNLAYFDKDRKTPMPAEPNHPLWDSELWHEIIKDNQKREYINDIEKISPVFKRWMDTLPAKIDLGELE